MIDWTHWHNEPFLVGGLIFLGWLYAILVGPLRNKIAPQNTSAPAAKIAQFYAALLCFYLAVGSPLDQIGERFLFWAHMLQHQLLVYPAAILMLRGIPDWLADAFLAKLPPRFLRVVFQPTVCGTAYIVVTTTWHTPFLYDLALRDKTVHVLEHLMFFAAALLLWWPYFSPSRLFPRAKLATQMLYIFAIVVGMTPLFIFLVFTENILYPTYEFAPRIMDMTPREDQVLGGTLMKLGGLAVFLATFGLSFFRWARTNK